MKITFPLNSLLLAAMLCLATPAHADAITPDAMPGLALVQLTDLALQRNPKTKQAWAALRASQAGVEMARAGYWPQIDATLSAQRSRSLSTSGVPSNILTEYGASVSLSYLLWDFGTRSGALEQSRFELTSAQLGQDQAV